MLLLIAPRGCSWLRTRVRIDQLCVLCPSSRTEPHRSQALLPVLFTSVVIDHRVRHPRFLVEVERQVMSHVRTVCARRIDERVGDRSRSRTDRATAVGTRIKALHYYRTIVRTCIFFLQENEKRYDSQTAFCFLLTDAWLQTS